MHGAPRLLCYPTPSMGIIGAEINHGTYGVAHREMEGRPVAIKIHRQLLEDLNGDK